MKKRKKKDSKKSVKAEKAISKKNIRPVGVKIISIFEYVLTGIFAFFGIMTFYLYSNWENISSQIPLDQIYSAIPNFSKSLLLTSGIFYLIFAVFLLIIAINLWKLKKWARIIHVVVYAVYAVIAIFNIFQGAFFSIVDLIISGIIIWYLGFNKQVIGVFK